MATSEYQRLADRSAVDGVAIGDEPGVIGDADKESAGENVVGFDRGLSTPLQRKEKGKKRGQDDLNEKKGLSEQPVKKRKCRPKVADDKFSLKVKKVKVKPCKPVKPKRATSKKDAPNKRKYMQKKKDLRAMAVRPGEPDGIIVPFPDEEKLNGTEGRDAVVSGETLTDSVRGEECQVTSRRGLEFDDAVQPTFSTQMSKVALKPSFAEKGNFSDDENFKGIELPSFEEENLSNSEAGEGYLSHERLLNSDEDKDCKGLCGETLDSPEVNSTLTVATSKPDTERELQASEPLWSWSDSSKKDTSTPIVYVRKKIIKVAASFQPNVVCPEPTSADEVKGSVTDGTLQTSAIEKDISELNRHTLDGKVENAMSSMSISQTHKRMTRALSSSISKNKDHFEMVYNPLTANGRMMRTCQCIQLMRKCNQNIRMVRKKLRMARKRKVDMSRLLLSTQTLKEVGSAKPILRCQELSAPTRKGRLKSRTRRRDFSSLLTVHQFVDIEASTLQQQYSKEIPKTDIWPTHGNLVTISKGASLSQEEKVCVRNQVADLNEEPLPRGFDPAFMINEHLFPSDTNDEYDYASWSYVSNQMDSALETGVDCSTMNVASQPRVHSNLHSMVCWTDEQASVHTDVYPMTRYYQPQNSLSLQADFYTTEQLPLWPTTYNRTQVPNPPRFSVSNEQELRPDTGDVFWTCIDPKDQNLHYNQSLVPHPDNRLVNYHLCVPYCEPPTLTPGHELVVRNETSLDIIRNVNTFALVPSTKKKKVHVNFDSRTLPMFNALMESEDSSHHYCDEDEESKKWWQEERRVFEEKVQDFISCMHKFQGNRRFSRWKGSVLDSVMGVYLTQNVSDFLSSSAYMSLASKYPAEPIHTHDAAQQENECVVGTSHDETVEACTSKLSHQDVLDKRFFDDEQVAQLRNPISTESGNELDEKSKKEDVLVSPSVDIKGFEEWLSLQEQTTQPQESTHQQLESVECLLQQKQGQTAQPQDSSPPIYETEELLSHHPERKTQPQVVSHTKSEKMTKSGSKAKKNKDQEIDWLQIKQKYSYEKRERSEGHTDSVDWEAVRRAPVEELAETIKKRGQHNRLALAMQEALNKIDSELGSLDLEWLRDTPERITRDILISIVGLGLKSVECIRLLALEQVAFPVDTNVGRIAVRLGWVDLKDVPPEVKFHLLEQYPLMDAIQKYLWPRLCELDQLTLYELHYQMITFGKVFCKKRNPYCNECPLRASCKYFASAFASTRPALPNCADSGLSESLRLLGDSSTRSQTTNHEPTLNLPTSSKPHVEMPALPEPHIEMLALSESHSEPPTSTEPLVDLASDEEESQDPLGNADEPGTPESDLGGQVGDIEDLYKDDIPTIVLNDAEFFANLKRFQMGEEASKALVVSVQAARIPERKLKDIKDLRTEHMVYEIPDSHPLLRLHGLGERDPDDPCFYLVSMWGPDESAIFLSQSTTSNDEERKCASDCHIDDSEYVLGSFMIPCRTALQGRFPLNGTYFQTNEVFADDETSHCPVKIPRSLLWNLRTRTVYCGKSTSSITTGLTTKEIQVCFWREYVCMRGFDRRTKEPKDLVERLHRIKSATQTKREQPKDRADKLHRLKSDIQTKREHKAKRNKTIV